MKKEKVRTLINEEDLDVISGGNKEITEETETAVCELCGSMIVIKNGSSMANHMNSAICLKIQEMNK